MQLLIIKNYKELSKAACIILTKELKKNPSSNIAFATGKTPKGLYKELIKANKKHLINFSKIKAFSLDEYYPIKKSDKQSYYYYLHSNLFSHINVNPSNIHLLNSEAKSPKKECSDKHCPFHNGFGMHGRTFDGAVIKMNMQKTAIIEWPRFIYLNKFERYEKRRSRIKVHKPDCIDLKVGDNVKVMETRPISKTKNFVIVEVEKK